MMTSRAGVRTLSVLFLACIGWCVGPAAAQDRQLTANDLVHGVLKAYAKSLQKGDVNGALKLIATEEDLKTYLPPDVAKKTAADLQNQVKAELPNLVATLKSFGKADLVEVATGVPRVVNKGAGGAIADAMLLDNPYVTFAGDANYLIELRFNIATILKVKADRWVITGLGLSAEQVAARRKVVNGPQAGPAEKAIHALFAEFARGAQQNDIEAVVKLFATFDDIGTIYPPNAARKSATELRSHIKLKFNEYTNALKAFGKFELTETDAGQASMHRPGDMGVKAEYSSFESGAIMFVRNASYLVEMRFVVGGVIGVDTKRKAPTDPYNPDRWVITNMETRVGKFQYIEPED
jgi:hypothetical protein